MPLSSQLGPEDGWKRANPTLLHFIFKGKTLCGETLPKDAPADNVRNHQCQKCFERTRNLYNSNDIKDAYRDIQ